ncbi:hypothetical protein KC347_g8043 [Hortaea werneckii]|nr:hypothetical protein KC347_g8043 [Hortaea werneckii]
MATLLRTRPQAAITASRRAFSTSTTRSVSLQLDKNDPDAVAEAVPPYPHGPTRWYKQSRLGLYGGQRIRFGNNVGDEFEVKTRRSWHPNVLTRKLYSKSLNRSVQVRVTARVLRTIDKLGGLDEYLLGEKEGRIRALGESGWWLRWAIMQTPAIRSRFAAERRRLGIPEDFVQEEQAEVAEAQNVIEQTSDVDPVEAGVELGEAVGTDGNFVVEQPPGLPPLTFRVGPGKHLVLTPGGWRRTRPTTNHAVEVKKEKIFERIAEEQMETREAEFRAELEMQQAEMPVKTRLSQDEMEEVLKAARKEWKADCWAQAEAQWGEHVAKREARKAERRAAKKAAERLEESSEAVATEAATVA